MYIISQRNYFFKSDYYLNLLRVKKSFANGTTIKTTMNEIIFKNISKTFIVSLRWRFFPMCKKKNGEKKNE